MIRQFLRSIPVVYKTYGFMQYLWYNYALKKAESQEKVAPVDDDGLAYPPTALRWRVHGAFDLTSFIQVGQRDCQDICTLLAQAGYKLADFKSILEFGCGCGRVLRHLRKQAYDSVFYGTDIDPEGVAWCQTNIEGATFSTNPFTPPSAYSDKQFDFIYAISVFTHLDEDMQFAWLNELKRIVRPGGVLLLTVHGSECYSDLPKKVIDTIESTGFLFRVSQTGKFKVDGLPDFYQSAYHSKGYVEREWGKLFRVLHYAEKGINDHQDAVLLMRVD